MKKHIDTVSENKVCPWLLYKGAKRHTHTLRRHWDCNCLSFFPSFLFHNPTRHKASFKWSQQQQQHNGLPKKVCRVPERKCACIESDSSFSSFSAATKSAKWLLLQLDATVQATYKIGSFFSRCQWLTAKTWRQWSPLKCVFLVLQLLLLKGTNYTHTVCFQCSSSVVGAN